MRVRWRIDEKEINNGTKRRKETNFLNKKVDAKRKSIQTADGLLCGVARAKEWHGYISAKKGASLLISLRQRHSFFLILYFPPTLQPQKSMTPNPLQTLWHTKTPAIQQQHLINAFSFSLFLLSFLFFWEEKPSIHRENGGTPNYMEWIGHPSPEASVANRFETPPPSYITAAHHLPNNFQYYLPMPRIETQNLSRRHSCYIKPTYFHRFINLKSKI